jgi:hypothetical protein
LFLGTSAGITGVMDDGKGYWRRRSKLDKKRWYAMESMVEQHGHAKLFGAASSVAGWMWRYLPEGMRRLADGGAFNRLVGMCRVLMEGDHLAPGSGAQIGDVEGLRGLDLSADSSGPHRVISEKVKAKSGEPDDFEIGSYRLTGLDALFRQMDEAIGDSLGRKSGKYAVARKVVTDRVVDEKEVLARMGSMEGWRKEVQGPRAKGQAVQPVRRVRVWVHAVEIPPVEWVESSETYEVASAARAFSSGYVTDWLVGNAEEGWKEAYAIVGGDWRTKWMGDGAYAVFTAIEVAEKRGRHWVRLPWCCKMRVQDVAVVGQGLDAAIAEIEGYGHGRCGVEGLRALRAECGEHIPADTRLVAVIEENKADVLVHNGSGQRDFDGPVAGRSGKGGDGKRHSDVIERSGFESLDIGCSVWDGVARAP